MKFVFVIAAISVVAQLQDVSAWSEFIRNADTIVLGTLFFIAMWKKVLRWGSDYDDLKSERDMYRDKVLEQAAENARTIQEMAETLRLRG